MQGNKTTTRKRGSGRRKIVSEYACASPNVSLRHRPPHSIYRLSSEAKTGQCFSFPGVSGFFSFVRDYSTTLFVFRSLSLCVCCAWHVLESLGVLFFAFLRLRILQMRLKISLFPCPEFNLLFQPIQPIAAGWFISAGADRSTPRRFL